MRQGSVPRVGLSLNKLEVQLQRRFQTDFNVLLQGPAAVPGGMIPPHVQRQMGGGAPFPPPAGPNFFNLPAAQASYPSQDPQQAGTR